MHLRCKPPTQPAVQPSAYSVLRPSAGRLIGRFGHRQRTSTEMHRLKNRTGVLSCNKLPCVAPCCNVLYCVATAPAEASDWCMLRLSASRMLEVACQVLCIARRTSHALHASFHAVPCGAVRRAPTCMDTRVCCPPPVARPPRKFHLPLMHRRNATACRPRVAQALERAHARSARICRTRFGH